jgi:hypothetical protein
MLVVTELHYHRNGVFGTGYFAGRAEWTPEDETFRVMFAAFITDDLYTRDWPKGCIAVMGDNDVGTSFRFEDFEEGLRKFIFSRGGQALAFPETIVR